MHREAVVEDKRLVRLLKQLKGLRGAHVFQFVDEEGQIRPVDSIAVNEYLDQRSGHHFTAKDFRTWKGSAVAAGILYREKPVEKLAARKRVVKAGICSGRRIARQYTDRLPKVLRSPWPDRHIFRRPTRSGFPTIPSGAAKSFSVDEQLLARFLRRRSAMSPRIAAPRSLFDSFAAKRRHLGTAIAS